MVLPKPHESLVGKVIGERYEVLEIIGDGGVGVVYRARLVNLERMVAVKVLHESLVGDPGFVGRFQREAVAMSRLYHPHCVAVIDSGVYQSRPYLVLEYLPGQTIRKLLEPGPFAPPRAVDIALQLLETLEYFHSHHVIHRDLKSENVMTVESSGTVDFVKVLDFGMAKILTGPGADSQLSNIGIVPGTPSVMAPEQIRQLPPDPRIDIYATGILMYEMVVGRRPFTGADMATVVKMQISTPPKPPREVLGENALSEELELVIIKALEKDRIDRFGTAGEMAAALRLTPEGRAITAPPPVDPRRPSASATARRSRNLLLLGAVGAVIVLGGVAAAVQLRAERPTPRAKAAVSVSASSRPAAVPTPAPAQALPAAAAPALPSWLAHRDLAVSYANDGRRDDALREIRAALGDDASAAAADPELAKAAVNALADSEQVAFVVDAFRSNPQLVTSLVETTAQGQTSEQRHAAREGLRALDQESSADLVAMLILDLEQASTCSSMRDAFKELRRSPKDPRVKELKANLRARSRWERHVRCLKRVLRR